jgi:hypothetical protein
VKKAARRRLARRGERGAVMVEGPCMVPPIQPDIWLRHGTLQRSTPRGQDQNARTDRRPLKSPDPLDEMALALEKMALADSGGSCFSI